MKKENSASSSLDGNRVIVLFITHNIVKQNNHIKIVMEGNRAVTYWLLIGHSLYIQYCQASSI